MKRLQGLPFWVLLVALALVAGCSGKYKPVPGAPDWVNRGGGAFRDAGGGVFYGVGAVSGISSESLSVQTADQRARADVARQLDTYVTALSRDYQTSTGAEGKQLAETQHVEESFRGLTQVTVRGARVIDRWKNPKTDTLYTLVRLDLAQVRTALEEMRDMDPALRSFIRSNAEKAFDDIRQDEQRR
jgi:hypothetical protein